MLIHTDRLFPAESGTRAIAQSALCAGENLPIISPHGHTQAAWFADN